MRYIYAFLLLILAVVSLVKLYALNSYENARKLYQGNDFKNNPSLIYSLDLAKAVKKAENAPFASNSSTKLEASYLIDLARQSKTTEEKIDIYCKALNTLKQSIQKEPFDAKAMINWLDVQEMVKGQECAENISEDKRKEIIETAVKNDPTNTEVLYAAGLLNYWDEKKEDAIPYFQRVLKLSTKLSEGNENTILEVIDSGEDFRKLVPARFPQVLEWSALLREKKPELFKSASNEIEKMQTEAIRQSLFELQGKLITKRIHLNNLESLLKVSANEKVRKLTFKEIANLLGVESELGKYLIEKSSLSEIQIVRASKPYDTLPHRGSFSGWDGQELVTFDRHETSIGFFKKESDKVKIIELVSNGPAQEITTGQLKFFVSDDNQNWKEISPAFRSITNPNIDRNYLIIEVRNSNFKYFKVNFHSPIKRGSFSNKESEIINVFG